VLERIVQRYTLGILTWAICFLLYPLSGNAQFDSLQIRIEPIDWPSAPAVHSGAISTFGGKWIYIGGRTNGLHGFQSANSFPNSGKNNRVYVIDPNDRSVISISITDFPVELYEPLTSSNIPFYSDGEYLYMCGGYGWNAASNTFKTFPVLTIADLGCLHDRVLTGENLEPCFSQLEDTLFAITGGHMEKLDSTFYLVFGHRFDGLYSVQNPGNAFFAQKYSNSVKRFRLNGGFENPQLSYLEVQFDSIRFHRRDYNLVPQIFPNGELGFTGFSGVFQYGSDIPYLDVVDIFADTAYVVEGFEQHLSQYHNAVMPLYDEEKNEMHTFFFGGMSRYYLDTLTGEIVDDTLVPFVRTISCVTRDAEGLLTETKLPIEMPGYLGSNMEFVADATIPLVHRKILTPDLNIEAPVRLGYLIGGIESPEPNISATDPTMSWANNQIFEVYLEKTPVDTGIVTGKQALLATPQWMRVMPNPNQGMFEVEFQTDKAATIRFDLYNRRGQLIKALHEGFFEAGIHKKNFQVQTETGVYYLRSRSGKTSKTISILIKP